MWCPLTFSYNIPSYKCAQEEKKTRTRRKWKNRNNIILMEEEVYLLDIYSKDSRTAFNRIHSHTLHTRYLPICGTLDKYDTMLRNWFAFSFRIFSFLLCIIFCPLRFVRSLFRTSDFKVFYRVFFFFHRTHHDYYRDDFRVSTLENKFICIWHSMVVAARREKKKNHFLFHSAKRMKMGLFVVPRYSVINIFKYS